MMNPDLYSDIRAFRADVLSTPEGQEMLKSIIAEQRTKVAEAMRYQDTLQQRVRETDEDARWLFEEDLITAKMKLQREQAILWRLRSNLQRPGEKWQSVEQDVPLMLLQAKQVPISQILGIAQPKVFGGRYVVRCPLHNEKTGSFTVYTKDNTYHCFGCQAHGDGVDLYQKLHECSFRKALLALTES